MSQAALEIVSGGIGVSIQDAGRTGYRSIGVPVSGALDPLLLAAANGLVGNAPAVAGLELRLVATALAGSGKSDPLLCLQPRAKAVPWRRGRRSR